MSFGSVFVQPAVPVLVGLEPLPVPAAPLPVARAPESVTEVAVIVPVELLTPWITTASPGRIDVLDTLWFLVMSVAEESVTLTVLPELSVR